MNDKPKLLLTLEDITDAQAWHVMCALGLRFPQFMFAGSADLVSPQAIQAGVEATSRHAVFAHGPWHFSARERPAMDSMRMFAEGAAAGLKVAASMIAGDLEPCNRDPNGDDDTATDRHGQQLEAEQALRTRSPNSMPCMNAV